MERVETGVIAIINRYGDIAAELEPISDNKYRFINKGAYYRLIFGEGGTSINAIDPEGGPLLAAGSKVGNKKISNIEKSEKDIFLTVETCEN